MSQDMETLYQARLRRFVTALNNRKPDRVPVRPFAAEFTGRHAGYTCQQLTQHYPDAINQPAFPSPVLRRGEQLHETTIYRFGVRK